MRDLPMICPTCLNELPADYPFDHFLIDYALGDRHELFTAMGKTERQETIRVARSRGWSDNKLAVHFHRSAFEVRVIAGEATRPPTAGRTYRRPHDEAIRELWEQGCSDRLIARRRGLSHQYVSKVRKRLGLAPNFDFNGGRRAAA